MAQYGKRVRPTISAKTGATCYNVVSGSDYIINGKYSVTRTPYLLGVSDTMTDYCPGLFEKRRAKGEVIMGACTHVRTEGTSDYTVCSAGPHPYTGSHLLYGQVAGCFLSNHTRPTLPASLVADIQAIKDDCLIDVYSQMNASALIGISSIRESLETVRMLRHPFKKFRLLSQKILKGKSKLLRRFRNFSQAVSNTWLEYRYGWRPLMFDVNAVAGILSKQRWVKPVRKIYRTRRLRTLPSEYTYVPNASLFTYWRAWYSYTVTHKVTVTAGVVCNVADVAPETELGLTTSDLAVALWDAIPYSFVVDWFTNVGSWLEAIKPKVGVTVTGNWVTVKRESIYEINIDQLSLQSAVPVQIWSYNNCGSAKITVISYSREVNVALPTLPGISGMNLSSTHLLDAAALLDNFRENLLKTRENVTNFSRQSKSARNLLKKLSRRR